MSPETSSPCIGGRGGPWIGALVSLHFAIVCGIKLQKGIGGDVCWMSHLSLAFTGAGLILRSPPLLSAALIGVLVPHSVWLLDCFGWILFGSFPLGVTAYLESADARTWIATAHHFYLIPLLLFVVLRCYFTTSRFELCPFRPGTRATPAENPSVPSECRGASSSIVSAMKSAK